MTDLIPVGAERGAYGPAIVLASAAPPHVPARVLAADRAPLGKLDACSDAEDDDYDQFSDDDNVTDDEDGPRVSFGENDGRDLHDELVWRGGRAAARPAG